MMKNATDILKDARARITDPAKWGQGIRARRADWATCCASEAIEEAADSAPWLNRHSRKAAFEKFRLAAGLSAYFGAIVDWNDDPKRAHAEILAAFDKAIEAAP